MKRIICLITCLALSFSPLLAQQQPGRPGESSFNRQLQHTLNAAQAETTSLATFNLDFPGGSPSELVKAIEKASGKPLNVIIHTEDNDVQIPALNMKDVNVAQLFAALENASVKSLEGNGYRFTTSYSFKTLERPGDNSIWYFHADKGPQIIPTDKVSQFYSLAPYLEHGFTVDDITTAIQAGWKMAGIAAPPELNYHKETKMLIAYGDQYQLRTIPSVLQSLPRSNASASELDEMHNTISHLKEQVELLEKQLNSHVPPSEKGVK